MELGVVLDLGQAEGPDAATPRDAEPSPDVAVDAGVDGGSTAHRVPMFVAQGMVGRTTVSCDDGHTWIADRSWDTEADPHLCNASGPIECYASGSTCGFVWYDGTCSESPDCDCGHSPGFGKGVVHGAGHFVATWGWGYPGAARRSRDGIRWETTKDGDQFGGLAYGGGRFVLASRTPFHSVDGFEWIASEEADFRQPDGEVIWSVRRFAFADVMGGRFVAVASGNNGRDLLLSSDGGDTWWRPTTIPPDCANEVSTYGGIVAGNGVIVIVDQQARACRSTDGGLTWSTVQLGNLEIYSHGIFNGQEFWFWGNDDQRWSSPDGQTWTATPMTRPQRIGPVARSPNGTLVAVENVWLGYQDQRFLRSDDDGLSWQVLPNTAFNPSHPIFYLSYGEAEPSPECPGR